MNGYGRIAAFPAASTGNDLVSLEATRPERTTLPRFYSRILTAAEQEGYRQLESSGLPFDQYVWFCWSVKESVYKFKKRQFPGLLFAPLRIVIRRIVPPSGAEGFYRAIIEGATIGDCSTTDDCSTIGDSSSAVSGDIRGAVLYARSLIRDGVIVTTVCEDEAFTGTYWGFSSIDSSAYADQSAAVRELVLGKLKELLGCEDLRLQKDDAGCPVVVTGGRGPAIPVSLAHHHRHIAYSFYLNKVV